jgi:hypothetical protein
MRTTIAELQNAVFHLNMDFAQHISPDRTYVESDIRFLLQRKMGGFQLQMQNKEGITVNMTHFTTKKQLVLIIHSIRAGINLARDHAEEKAKEVAQ